MVLRRGMTSSNSVQTPNTRTNTSSPSAKNADAKWAIGEMRMTTGAAAPSAEDAGRSPVMPHVLTRTVAPRNLTAANRRG